MERITAENEHKFLIRENGKWFHVPGFFEHFGGIESFFNRFNYKMTEVSQGYISELPIPVQIEPILQIAGFVPSEIRIRQKGSIFLITLKSDPAYVRQEFETEISRDTFITLWPLTEGKRIKKNRLKLEIKGYIYEFDVFKDHDLILAELETRYELRNVPDELIPGVDVTGNKQYYNSHLAC
jgi:CYTH domain-containing protein